MTPPFNAFMGQDLFTLMNSVDGILEVIAGILVYCHSIETLEAFASIFAPKLDEIVYGFLMNN
jgi:hypothetical protein